MEKRIGKVIEVFIPKEYKNGRLIDIMESKKIGFKILIDNEILELIEEQNEINCNIMREDFVVVTKQNISGVDFIDMELYEGEIYE